MSEETVPEMRKRPASMIGLKMPTIASASSTLAFLTSKFIDILSVKRPDIV